MKKTIICLFMLIGLVVNNANAQQALEPFKKDNLFGKIMRVTTIDYTIKKNIDGGTKVDSLIKNTTSYDSIGNIKERIYYGRAQGNQFQFSTRFIYLQKESMGDYKVIWLYTNHKVAELHFNKNNNIVEFISYNDDGNFSYKIIYKYDKRRFLANEKEYDQKGNMAFTIKYKVNSTGLIVEGKSTTSNYKTIKTHYTYTAFDDFGNWIKCTKVPELDNGTPSTPLYTERKIIYYK